MRNKEKEGYEGSVENGRTEERSRKTEERKEQRRKNGTVEELKKMEWKEREAKEE